MTFDCVSATAALLVAVVEVVVVVADDLGEFSWRQCKFPFSPERDEPEVDLECRRG